MKKDTSPITLNKKAMKQPMKVEQVWSKLDSNKDIVSLYLQDVQKVPLDKSDESVKKEKMIMNHLRLVIKIAKNYQNRGLPLLDLINEGNLGLLHAADKFDKSKNCKFSTYSVWWVRQYIERAIMNQAKTIRLPVYRQKEINQLMQKIKDVKRKEQLITDFELASNLGIDSTEFQEILDSGRQDMVDIDTVPNLTQNTVDGEEEGPESMFERYDADLKVQELVSTLPKDMKKVIILRYGLFDFDAMTLEEVGKKLKISREKVRRLQLQALSYLEKILSEQNLN